jgi:hypothetical protein
MGMLQPSAPSARRHADNEHGAGPNAEFNKYSLHQLDDGPYIVRTDSTDPLLDNRQHHDGSGRFDSAIVASLVRLALSMDRSRSNTA